MDRSLYSPLPIFAFGTLSLPGFLEGLLVRTPAMSQGEGLDCELRRLSGVPYPGLIYAPGSRTDGFLLEDLSVEEMALLDDYEDSFCELQPLEVQDPLGQVVTALAFFVPESWVLTESWSLEWFLSQQG